MRSDRLPPIAAALAGGAVGIVLVLASIPFMPVSFSPRPLSPSRAPPSSTVKVTQVWWVAENSSNQTSPSGGCLAGMPRTTSGLAAATASWFYVSTSFSAAAGFVGSCYVFSIWVATPGFADASPAPPSAWFAVNGSVPISLNISTPRTSFGPAPIFILVDTSTTPGCLACP